VVDADHRARRGGSLGKRAEIAVGTIRSDISPTDMFVALVAPAGLTLRLHLNP
jgi:hypothetical protein